MQVLGKQAEAPAEPDYGQNFETQFDNQVNDNNESKSKKSRIGLSSLLSFIKRIMIAIGFFILLLIFALGSVYLGGY
ncbi:MAG TPA: hypothetical protein PKY82_32225 [Pyrinomonadaceae bacterium]|nr:hypothetical protein [Pyrinomonadaceae bacterium]